MGSSLSFWFFLVHAAASSGSQGFWKSAKASWVLTQGMNVSEMASVWASIHSARSSGSMRASLPVVFAASFLGGCLLLLTGRALAGSRAILRVSFSLLGKSS